MTWIEATHQKTFEVDVPLEEVADFFSDPSKIVHCMYDLDHHEVVDDQTYRWILNEKGAKGITFQADYTVRYARDGEVITWETEGDGTMRSKGIAKLESAGSGTRIDYEETLASDLPIPKLARRVFKPIVKMEVKKGVERFLEEVIEFLESGGHREA